MKCPFCKNKMNNGIGLDLYYCIKCKNNPYISITDNCIVGYWRAICNIEDYLYTIESHNMAKSTIIEKHIHSIDRTYHFYEYWDIPSSVEDLNSLVNNLLKLVIYV